MNSIVSPAGAADTTSAQLLALYEISNVDLANVRTYGNQVIGRLDEYVERFYTWLATRPEFDVFFSDPAKLASVQSRQLDYWRDFFSAQIDDGYIDRRRMVGTMHARIGLPLPAYFAAMNYSLHVFIDDLADPEQSAEQRAATARAVSKLMHLDTAVVVESYNTIVQRTLQEQHDTLMQMSTPVTAVWDDVLMLPVVGIVDSKRAQDMMNAMLVAIQETQSKVIIMDISGVAVVDTAVANHLIKITKATRLMGCECTISGVSPAIAQTIVELGIDVGTVRTTVTMKDALVGALQATRALGSDARSDRA